MANSKTYAFLIIAGVITLCTLLGAGAGASAEKIKFGVAFKGNPAFELVNLAAQQEGIWRKHGLALEWFGFRGSTPMNRAISAKALELGIGNAPGVIQAASRGVPVLIVAPFASMPQFSIWVLSESPLKKGSQLKGEKVGIPRLGGTAYAYGVLMARSLGLEGKIRFVGVGGMRGQLATLKSRAVAGTVISFNPMAEMVARGEVRPLVNASDYLPREWLGGTLVGRKDFLETNPAVTTKVVKAVNEAVNYVRSHRSWAGEKLQAELRFSEKASGLVADKLYPQVGERLNYNALKNVIKFLVEYNLVKKADIPPSDKLIFASEFTR